MFELHVHTYLIKQVHLESYLGGRWRWRRILIFLIVYTFVNYTSPVFLKYPLLKWQTLSNMMSAANNSPNEVLGNERNQMISQLSPDWSLSCQPPRVQFKFLLQTHNSSKDNIFTPGTEEINWTLKIFFTCTFCLVERKVTLIDCVSSQSILEFFLLSIIFSQKEKKWSERVTLFCCYR